MKEKCNLCKYKAGDSCGYWEIPLANMSRCNLRLEKITNLKVKVK